MRGKPLGALRPLTFAACAALLAGCSTSTTGTPIAASLPASSATQSPTIPTPSLDLTPPTTSVANPRVTGTTFDGCASVTKEEEAQWELRPDSKRDTAKNGPLGSESVRGCLWNGKKGQVRVYSFDGSIPHWQNTNADDFDSMKAARFGAREGIVAHSAPNQIPGCTVLLPSQNGIAAVMALPSIALEDQGVDMCPFATQVMTAIEPRIP